MQEEKAMTKKNKDFMNDLIITEKKLFDSIDSSFFNPYETSAEILKNQLNTYEKDYGIDPDAVDPRYYLPDDELEDRFPTEKDRILLKAYLEEATFIMDDDFENYPDVVFECLDVIEIKAIYDEKLKELGITNITPEMNKRGFAEIVASVAYSQSKMEGGLTLEEILTRISNDFYLRTGFVRSKAIERERDVIEFCDEYGIGRDANLLSKFGKRLIRPDKEVEAIITRL